jgi:23S rRNA pseudouridine1911/1915/1917 synthase
MIIEILHDASGVLAVAKPAGLPTQAPPGIASIELLVREQFFGESVRTARESGQRRHPGGFLGVPHRLDRAVSGVLLLATTPRAARQLSRQFERRQVGKTYLAVVTCPAQVLVEGQSFEWRDTIRKVPGEPRAEVVPEGTDGGRSAVTTGRVVAVDSSRAIVALEPRTGRMHQLRVQAASRGLPVVGDTMYAGGTLPETAGDRSAPIGLHAWRIQFTDPDTGEPVEVTCPPPLSSLWNAWAARVPGWR